MGFGDKLKKGRPRNSSKRDWTLYQGAGSGGGGSVTATGKTRQTFWVDHNRFMTFNRRLITQNVSFQLYGTATPSVPKPVYINVAQSNDAPDEVIMADPASLYIDPATLLPPYYIDTKFLTQPTDFNYQNDQGTYVYGGYQGSGLGLGNSGKIVQTFIPQSSLLTGTWLKRLFRAGDLTDVTKFHDIIVEVWDKNKNVIGTATISKLAHQLAGVDNHTEFYTTISGVDYWIDLDQVRVKFLPPIKVEIGATHYICVKQATSTTLHDYGVGSNTDTSGNYVGGGKRYIYGDAYSAPYASTTLTAIGPNIDICFVTQRNNGRTALTFLWTDPAFYWYDPLTVPDQFKVVKEDFDQVI